MKSDWETFKMKKMQQATKEHIYSSVLLDVLAMNMVQKLPRIYDLSQQSQCDTKEKWMSEKFSLLILLNIIPL